MSALTPMAALWCLIAVAPICIWVAWSDMKFMKIPNKAVVALAVVYLLLGPLLLPFVAWLWGWALLAGVLVTGFLLNMGGLIGAGDAKFAAAMAPFFIGGDTRFILALFAACLLGAFASHRGLRLIGPFRAATADWASWTHKDFPMGLALAGTLIFYLLAVIRFTVS
ncbi:prepilin peptidase [Fertoebacter nigrum]|uniref:Prepilin peptidase n=1 Tax=Fertoeibacter niger TaxID=2656921 RepID=A0A8X8GZL0_9RHOB|nr:prepilin peptidase [Fertoeibacter niger]NUB44170.1 prepilin peptidase [Fertoeibacter niger]